MSSLLFLMGGGGKKEKEREKGKKEGMGEGKQSKVPAKGGRVKQLF